MNILEDFDKDEEEMPKRRRKQRAGLDDEEPISENDFDSDERKQIKYEKVKTRPEKQHIPKKKPSSQVQVQISDQYIGSLEEGHIPRRIRSMKRRRHFRGG
eukprot:CAMPEP_0202966470 /NCGR_PEP_ID=MMETSP1396-20130829/10885_1 /ASSEMBLY_ACC=CAM_ASM_000872 /TAXON_ID= /ORGANISM="Pseudokeronopsis sp., Strain Brazil" /LENGTH=100 /DNA_ID=CAMNT_0049690353 /DNA_START=168 /DNA_END=470 /DNA_ORIENTATION=-